MAVTSHTKCSLCVVYTTENNITAWWCCMFYIHYTN